MSGTLYIVGTPIGNLKDITYRAVEVLGAVDLIACEDTRVTRVLLNHYGIKKPLMSYYKHKEREGTEKILAELDAGRSVALVTDAGMPAISDPGAILVEGARLGGFTVTVVPGATAVASAVALSGVQAKGFTFLGFLPEKNKDREEFLAPFVYSPLPLVFYCSPHSINEDAAFLFEKLGDRRAWAVKEITKMFENVSEYTLKSLNIDNPRGEFVLIVEGQTGDNPLNELSVKEQVMHYMQSGLTKKDAIKRTAADRGVDKNSVYVEVLDV